jgi:hypothetical protein
MRRAPEYPRREEPARGDDEDTPDDREDRRNPEGEMRGGAERHVDVRRHELVAPSFDHRRHLLMC